MTSNIRKALVVDDSRMARTSLAKLLKKRGIEVDVAESGQGALDYMAANEPPDAVFMDYTMPDMDGIEAVQQIRQRHGDTSPCAMYTGQEDIADTAQRNGVSAFLMKPASDQLVDDVLAELSAATSMQPAPGDKATDSKAETQPPADAPAPLAGETTMAASSSPAESDAGLASGASGEASATADTAEPTDSLATETATRASGRPYGGDGHESEHPTGQKAPSLGETAPTRDDTTDVAQAAAGNVSDQEARSTPEAPPAQGKTAPRAAQEAPSTQAAAEAHASADAAHAGDAPEKPSAVTTPTREPQAGGETGMDIEQQVAHALQSNTAAKRIAQVFLQKVWPKVRPRVADDITESLYDDIRRVAREAAAETAAHQGRDETDTSSQIDERTAALRAEINTDIARSIEQAEARLKRLIIAVAAGLSAAMAVGLTLVLLIG